MFAFRLTRRNKNQSGRERSSAQDAWSARPYITRICSIQLVTGRRVTLELFHGKRWRTYPVSLPITRGCVCALPLTCRWLSLACVVITCDHVFLKVSRTCQFGGCLNGLKVTVSGLSLSMDRSNCSLSMTWQIDAIISLTLLLLLMMMMRWNYFILERERERETERKRERERVDVIDPITCPWRPGFLWDETKQARNLLVLAPCWRYEFTDGQLNYHGTARSNVLNEQLVS